jgi:gliding motility-associated-like protein
MKKVFIGAILGFVSLQIFSQNDCGSAMSLCNDFYQETNSSNSIGVPEYVGGCNAAEYASMWYTFTVQQAGSLSFVLNPMDNADDYDWVLFDITNSGCAGIGSTAIEVSCNSYGDFFSNGPTGISSANGGTGNSNGPGNTNGPAFNQDIAASVGQTYALCIMNWSQSTSGYSIDFGQSTAALYDNFSPDIIDVVSECNQNFLVATFSEPLESGSVQTQDFSLQGPGGPIPITNAVVNNNNGLADDEVVISVLVNNLAAGNYTLSISSNFGGVADACGNVFQGSFDFNYNPVDLSIDAGEDVSICPGETYLLEATGNYQSIQWSGGPATASFLISNGGIFTVTASANGCSLSDEVEVEEIVLPNWDLGLDTNECSDSPLIYYTTEPVAWENGEYGTSSHPDSEGYWSAIYTYNGCTMEDSVWIEVHDPPVIDLGSDTILCQGQSLTLITPVPVHWNSSINTSNTYNIQYEGTYTATFDEVCFVEDLIGVVYHELPFIPWHEEQHTICIGDSLLFDASDYPAWHYEWWDGDTTSNRYIGESGEFYITLSNDCGNYTATFDIYDEDCEEYCYLPNAFSPNQDGINDAWFGIFNHAESIELNIFNAWGELIYETTDMDFRWQGNKQGSEYYLPNGVYSYRLKIDYIIKKQEVITGWIGIWR